MSMLLPRLFLGFAALIFSWSAAAPLAAELAPAREFEVNGVLRDDHGNVATDISGIACAPHPTSGAAPTRPHLGHRQWCCGQSG